MNTLEYVLAGALGVSLAAATGFRVFVPVLVAAIAARFGFLHLPEQVSWLGSNLAILMLAVAAAAEVAAYYIPGVDNVLDALVTPLAVVAGTMMVAAPLWDLPPVLKWSAAIVAGGGAAGLTQGLTSLLRAKSTIATGGLANPVVATAELGGSVVLSVMAVLLPLLAFALFVVCVVMLWRWVRRLAARAV
jgi:Domain of unknown function (DUF4126)